MTVIRGPMTGSSISTEKEKRNYYRYYDTPDGCDVDKKRVSYEATKIGRISRGGQAPPAEPFYHPTAIPNPHSVETIDTTYMLVVTTRYGVILGMIAGTYDVLMYSQAVGFANIMARYARHVIPLGLMGATFTLVANGLLINRKEDDALNYFLGGLACGPLAAFYVRNKHGLFAGGMVLGIAGMVKKGAIDNGFCFFPKIHSHMGMVDSWKRDFTVVDDPKIHFKHTCAKGSECGK